MLNVCVSLPMFLGLGKDEFIIEFRWSKALTWQPMIRNSWQQAEIIKDSLFSPSLGYRNVVFWGKARPNSKEGDAESLSWRCLEVTWQGSTGSWEYVGLLPWQPGFAPSSETNTVATRGHLGSLGDHRNQGHPRRSISWDDQDKRWSDENAKFSWQSFIRPQAAIRAAPQPIFCHASQQHFLEGQPQLAMLEISWSLQYCCLSV